MLGTQTSTGLDQATKEWQADFFIAENHPAFAGHFPNQPIFPAVSQIELVLQVLTEGLKQAMTLSIVQRAKFQALLLPNTQIQIKVQVDAHKQVRWQIIGDGTTYSSGLLTVKEKNPLS